MAVKWKYAEFQRCDTNRYGVKFLYEKFGRVYMVCPECGEIFVCTRNGVTHVRSCKPCRITRQNMLRNIKIEAARKAVEPIDEDRLRPDETVDDFIARIREQVKKELEQEWESGVTIRPGSTKHYD